MKAIKAYFVFTSTIYRLVMFGVMPLALIVLYALAGAAMKDVASFLVTTIPFLAIMVDVISDTWVFGGIQRKDAAKMDFLRTSPRGMGLLQNALAVDLARRLLTLSGIMALCLLTNAVQGVRMFQNSPANGVGVILSLILSAYTVSALCTLLSRFGTMLWQNILVCYLGLFVESVCVGFLVSLGHPWVWCGVYGVLALGASVLSVKAVMKNVRGGYYDE
ncbi:MAG: hypothetical protein NC245_17140 [Muribaculum sp.]|nr:hypothetical protein [Muribaculum sp.]